MSSVFVLCNFLQKMSVLRCPKFWKFLPECTVVLQCRAFAITHVCLHMCRIQSTKDFSGHAISAHLLDSCRISIRSTTYQGGSKQKPRTCFSQTSAVLVNFAGRLAKLTFTRAKFSNLASPEGSAIKVDLAEKNGTTHFYTTSIVV